MLRDKLGLYGQINSGGSPDCARSKVTEIAATTAKWRIMAGQKTVVAYLGPPSSYTHQAALKTFSHQGTTFSTQTSIQDVFEAVQCCTATFGIVPFENSSNGSVIDTLDLFADRQTVFPSITVCDEAYLDIHHYLLGHAAPSTLLSSSASSETIPNQAKDVAATPPAIPSSNTPTHTQTPSIKPAYPRTKPLTSLAHITRVFSHPQAFGQSEHFLRTYLPHASRLEVTSTSAAALRVSQDKTGNSAAISSLVAAEEHGLEVLGKGIEDTEDNCTRFFILRRHDDGSLETRVCVEAVHSNPDEEEGPSKTLVSFTIDHLLPGALADALMVFKTLELNLTSIYSRPSRSRPWHYIFFVEFEGRKGQLAVDRALEDLDKRVEGWRWLGSWKDRMKLASEQTGGDGMEEELDMALIR